MAPRSTTVLYNLGILYKRQPRYPDAEQLPEQVVEDDPANPARYQPLFLLELTRLEEGS